MQVWTRVFGNTEVIASGEAFESVDHGDQNVLGPAVAQLGHYPQPEFRTFGLLDPKPKDFLVARTAHPNGQVHRAVVDRALVADFDPHRVKENDCVGRFQPPALPGADLLEHHVGHCTHQVGRDLGPVQFADMSRDLTRRHPARVQCDDLVVEAGKPPPVLADQHRVEAPVPIARNRQLQLARVRQHGLCPVAMSRPLRKYISGRREITSV